MPSNPDFRTTDDSVPAETPKPDSLGNVSGEPRLSQYSHCPRCGTLTQWGYYMNHRCHYRPEPKKVSTTKCNKRIERLERRMKWLDDRAVDLPDGSFDMAEASAIRWALPILREYVRSQETLSNEKGVEV